MWWTDTSMSRYPATRYVSSYHVNHGICTNLLLWPKHFQRSTASIQPIKHLTPWHTLSKKTADKQRDVPESSCNHNLGWTNTPVISSHQPPPIQKDLGKVEEQKATKFPSQSLIFAGAYGHMQTCSKTAIFTMRALDCFNGSTSLSEKVVISLPTNPLWFLYHSTDLFLMPWSPILQLSHHFFYVK